MPVLFVIIGLSLAAQTVQAEPVSSQSSANTTTSNDPCWQSFYQIRQNITGSNLQSVILQTDAKGLQPYVTLHHTNDKGENYNMWQTLNGDVRGYAVKEGHGFDYITSLSQIKPLTWHPTFIWDSLFASKKPLRNYACVFTGRTRVMGKRATLLRLIPQEGLRYSYMIAKEDSSNFPLELTVSDNRGVVSMRLTVIDSRVVIGMDFPIQDEVFDQLRRGQTVDNSLLPNAQESEIALNNNLSFPDKGKTGLATNHPTVGDSADFKEANSDELASTENSDSSPLADIASPTPAATMTGNAPQNNMMNRELLTAQPWPELNIPLDFKLIAEDDYPEVSQQCKYQEYTDGLVTFRVYRNSPTTMHFPVLNNITLTVMRKNSSNYEYTVVGEMPVSLAEYILSKIRS